MTTYTAVPAYAKINLTLDVHTRRPDGYHNIRSVMQTVALHDTLEIIRVPGVPGVSLTVIGEEAAGIPSDESNIVHRAAVRLQKTAAARSMLPADRSGLHITLTKRIPSQAGLGGGSSDAATTLQTVNALLGLKLSLSRLSEVAALLGADVPFFLTGGSALVEGLGERVTALPPLNGDFQVVILKPAVGVSTAGAYASLDDIGGRIPGNATDQWEKPRAQGQPLPLGNDFQDSVIAAHPEIARAYDAMRGSLGTGSGPLLSGSGSAIFCLIQGETAAHLLADDLLGAGVGRVWVTKIQGRHG